MREIYDNGEKIIGQIYYVKEYLCENAEETWEIEELIHDLEDFDASDIVCINYDNGMGYTIERWTKKDLVKKGENYE